MTRANERQLIQRAVAGDRRAFGELVALNSRMVALTIRGVIPTISREELEDAAQEVFLSAWRGIGSFRMESGFSTWLHTIATRHCWRRAKRTRRKRDLLSSADDDDGPTLEVDGGARTDARILRDERAAALERALAELPEEFRMVLLLRVVEEMPVEQVAAILEISEGTVKSRLSRARSKMKELLGDDFLDTERG